MWPRIDEATPKLVGFPIVHRMSFPQPYFCIVNGPLFDIRFFVENWGSVGGTCSKERFFLALWGTRTLGLETCLPFSTLFSLSPNIKLWFGRLFH